MNYCKGCGLVNYYCGCPDVDDLKDILICLSKEGKSAELKASLKPNAKRCLGCMFYLCKCYEGLRSNVYEI